MNTEDENQDGADEAAAPATEEQAAPASNETLDSLDDMDEGEAVKTEYFKPAEGDITRCIYIGPATFTNQKQEKLPAIKIQLKDGSFAICASKILVEDLGNFKPGSAVSITNVGMGGPAGGNQFHKWEVKPLTPKA